MARTPDQPVSTDRGRRRRDDLLTAARAVFEELGYANTTVSEIIRVSGGSRASFYSYFASADDALHELVDALTEELFEASTEALHRGDTPIETLTASIRQFMHAYRDRAALLAVLDQATATSEAFRVVRLEIRRRFAEAIGEALQRGLLADDDELSADDAAIALGGMVEDMARGRYLLGQPIDEEAAIRTLVVIWARAIRLPMT